MKNLAHLTYEEMVRLIDSEIDTAAQARVETHLANCAECLKRYEDLAEFSETLSHAIETIPVAVPAAAHQRLEAAMEQRAGITPMRPIRWWQWAAVAAGLVVTLFLLHSRRSSFVRVEPAAPANTEPAPVVAKSNPVEARPVSPVAVHHKPRQQSSNLDNAFIRLPYSDPSLPINTADVIRVEIPLSALASSGVIRTQPGTADALVKADVLLGLDGQPSAIRLVSATMITHE
ncbi:MAG TPA: zf-HC2 domain-containing protein [Bryobacteraceae bacterium]|nr:zf-HC2 domain-containing protein [Bryobacteraceae bacterium]